MASLLLTPVAVSVPGSLPDKESNCECRVYERHSSGLPSRCQPASAFGKEDLKWSGTIDNVSIGGLGLRLERRFEKGTGLVIELPNKVNDGSYVVLAKVVHVARQSDNSYLLGCKFVSELSEDEVRRLLPETQPSNPTATVAENTPRPQPKAAALPLTIAKPTAVTPSVLPVHLVVEIAAGTTVACTIPDFGAFNCSWPLAPGTVGTLKGIDRQGEPWKLRVKVRQCISEGDGWKLECNLTKKTSHANLLKALGGLILAN